MFRPIYFSPESYPRYVGTERHIPEYFPKTPDQTPFPPIGYIPQINHTFAYLEETYGAVNEHQVAIGESTCSGVFGAIPLGAPNGTAMLSIDALTQIAMERSTTAVQAIQLMGDLAERYGFYGAGAFEGTAESLAVSDTHEAWIFHILADPTGTSAIWVAQRVPDDAFAVLANMFVIRQVDPNDHDNFRMSASVHTVAQEYGWWSPDDGQLLDFTKIYSDGEYAHKYYSGRRVWGAYRLAGREFPDDYSDLQSMPVYPVYTTPAYKLSVQDLFRFHRDTYAGTKYSLGAEGQLAAGPFGSPDRWKAGPGEANVGGNWERPIGLYRTSDTYVVQSKQASCCSHGAVLWFGPASALGTVFTPFVVGMKDIPASFRTGHHAVFSRETAFWGACVLHNVANMKWNYAIKDVTALQDELESTSIQLMAQLAADASMCECTADQITEGTIPKLSERAESMIVENAANVVHKLWALSDHLLWKYASGFVNEPELSQMVGYPEWWLEAVGYPNGPPPPPTKPKCCHPPKDNDLMDQTREVASENTEPRTGKAAMRQFLRINAAEMQ